MSNETFDNIKTWGFIGIFCVLLPTLLLKSCESRDTGIAQRAEESIKETIIDNVNSTFYKSLMREAENGMISEELAEDLYDAIYYDLLDAIAES